MRKSENPEELYALDDGLSARQTMALVYIAYSATFIISLLSLFSPYPFPMIWLFFLLLLSSLTVFSIPYLSLILCSPPFTSTPLPYAVFMWTSLFGMIFVALFYALVAYGLLKKKRVASVAALISSLLTIFADIVFCYLSWSTQKLIWLSVFGSGMFFNILLLLVFKDMLRRR